MRDEHWTKMAKIAKRNERASEREREAKKMREKWPSASELTEMVSCVFGWLNKRIEAKRMKS